jgi:hypothetical protein
MLRASCACGSSLTLGKENVDPFIYIKAPPETSLEAFASVLKEVFPLTGWHERESSNYYRGCYWLGALEGKEVKLCWLDSAGFEDYVFCVVVTPKKKSRSARDASDEDFVGRMAQSIAEKSYPAFIPEDDISDRGNRNGILHEKRA